MIQGEANYMAAPHTLAQTDYQRLWAALSKLKPTNLLDLKLELAEHPC